MARSDHYRIPLQRELIGRTCVFPTGCKGKWLWFTGMPSVFFRFFFQISVLDKMTVTQQKTWTATRMVIRKCEDSEQTNRLFPPLVHRARKAAKSAEQSAGCSFWSHNYLKADMKEVIWHEVNNSRGLNINSQGVSPSPMFIKIHILILRGRTVKIWLLCPSVAKENKKMWNTLSMRVSQLACCS